MVVFNHLLVMATLLMSILGLLMGIHQNCAVWREIAPCTCSLDHSKISIECKKMQSFAEVASLLQNKFSLRDRVNLDISFSNLEDLSQRSFRELNMTIENLKIHHDDLSELSPYTFSGLTHVNYLSLADNPISYMPIKVFEKMPNIKTLDLGRLRLKSLPEESFQNLPHLETLVLPDNMLFRMDTHVIPPSINKLHLARDAIRDLNGTLRHLTELQWLFLTGNELTDIEGQLPPNSLKIKMLHAANNRIRRLPQEFRGYTNLENLFFQNNLLTGLDNALAKCRRLESVVLEHNRISTLLPDDFSDTENLRSLELQHNEITTLNHSLLPLRKLKFLNLTHNLLTEFSWQEVKGLSQLTDLDLSFNKIGYISGSTPNLLEWDTELEFLKLDHNELYSLNGALSGLRNLVRLNVSFNRLTTISPDDLIGLDQLTMLDVSHNRLTTLEETSKTFLPALEELIASHNFLTVLDKDFHGLPVLCWAELSSNQITALGRDLVSKTHCKLKDGVHEDSWGTLRIYLTDNPILCDAALPEINSYMEINHTRIVGVSHCPPLSEQPVTTKPSPYLGYIPENTPPPIPLLHAPIYDATPMQASNNIQEEKTLDEINYKNIHREELVPLQENQAIRHSHGLQYSEPLHLRTVNVPGSQPQPIIADDPFKRSSETQINADLDNSALSPLNEDQNSAKTEPFKRSSKLTIAELPLNEQPLYTNVNPSIQEQQISQLASEIEELRSRVQELTSENQRLSLNLHSIMPSQGENVDNKIYHPLLSVEQLILASTEKSLNSDDLRMP